MADSSKILSPVRVPFQKSHTLVDHGLFSKCGGQKLKKFHLMPSIFSMKMMTNSSPPNSVQVCVCVCARVCVGGGQC